MTDRRIATIVILLLAAALEVVSASARTPYPWLQRFDARDSIIDRIRPPRGYGYERHAQGSFEEWLLHLPLKSGRPPVYLHNGRKKVNQTAHAAVFDLDVGSENLQQCADAIIRLRAEYLYSQGRDEDIHFNFTSGHRADFVRWENGYRPRVSGNRVSWKKVAGQDSSYAALRGYLRVVFTYAGTASLAREVTPVPNTQQIRAGDVFITPGSPGHAVLVVATSVNARGQRLFLLAQSYMPAQDVHLLKNPLEPDLSPWYEIPERDRLVTPEWVFWASDLRRFKE